MTEEVPKNHGFLKFIVIFMGILIVLGLGVVVWKVIDLAKQKAAREKREAAQVEKSIVPDQPVQVMDSPFDYELMLESDEKILEISDASGGLWVRIGVNGKTQRMILLNRAGKLAGSIKVGRENEETVPAN